MNILITGAAGFIGSHLFDALREEHHVVGIDNFSTGNNQHHRVENLNVVHLDEFAKHLDLIVHCAASYKNPHDWAEDEYTNIQGSMAVAKTAMHHGCRVIYFQTALPPTSSYAISKIAGQHYLELADVPLTTFRLANVYGPRNLSGPVPAFFKRLSAGEPCTVSITTRDMVYINDLVMCVMDAIDNETVGTYNISTGKQTPIAHLYSLVEAHFPDAPDPVFVMPGADDVGALEVEPSIMFPIPDCPLADGVNAAVEWYQKNGVAETYTHLRVA